ncbi:hypothetical protein E2980_19260 [Cohnella luojiensis]|uniref:Flavodoxin-like fold domain-containing protein n=1 Tax=Cohnella luojiensis TaxID=652876 RepID=A0A4Y8LW56_9BACL|nr:hypothetical protein E2980_19260 [Cohnella luojiensis]
MIELIKKRFGQTISASVYTNNDWYTEVEYSHKYLKSMFNFLGIEDYQIIRAQGTAIRNREEILEKAYKEAEEAAKHLSFAARIKWLMEKPKRQCQG